MQPTSRRPARFLCLQIAATFALVLPLPCQSQAPVPVTSMAREAKPQFDVAVITPTDPADNNQGFHLNGHRIFLENEPLANLVAFAYAVHRSQILDAPTWFDRDRFDIKGIPDLPGSPDLKQLQQMVQHLLTDRFQLKFRRDRHELSVYAITLAKSGSKLTRSIGDPNSAPDQTGYGQGTQQVMKFSNNTMSDLALEMQFFLDRPVVDQTGLAGRFDFVLTWTPDIAATGDANAAPGILTAFQEQLGLKLQPTREPVDVLVVEHVEHPSAN